MISSTFTCYKHLVMLQRRFMIHYVILCYRNISLTSWLARRGSDPCAQRCLKYSRGSFKVETLNPQDVACIKIEVRRGFPTRSLQRTGMPLHLFGLGIGKQHLLGILFDIANFHMRRLGL
ncbi:unnamed protein product [Musa textilis]